MITSKRQDILDEYKKRRQEVVRLRDEELLTFDEIAKAFGITRPRVIQMYQAETKNG